MMVVGLINVHWRTNRHKWHNSFFHIDLFAETLLTKHICFVHSGVGCTVWKSSTWDCHLHYSVNSPLRRLNIWNERFHDCTKSSQVVSHPSTVLVQCCLTWVLLLEMVYPTRKGRRLHISVAIKHISDWPISGRNKSCELSSHLRYFRSQILVFSLHPANEAPG